MAKISHSEVDAYLLCERKDYYGAGLDLQRNKLSLSLRRGIFTHDILAYFFAHLKDNPGDWAGADRAALARRDEAANEDPLNVLVGEDFMRMYNAFKAIGWYKNGYKVLAVEQKYGLPLSDTLIYPFTVDLVLEDKNGMVAVVDHKTTYDFYSEGRMALAPQLPKYIGAMRALGMQADYALYHELRYRVAKSHTAADIIRTTEFTPSVARIQNSFSDQINVARKLERIRQLPIEEQSEISIRTANNFVCNSCSFKDLCVAELNNQPIDLIIEANYTKRDDRYKEIEIEDE